MSSMWTMPKQWWGWNFSKEQWFPCLGKEHRECVEPGGVIVFSDLEHRDSDRDQIISLVASAITPIIRKQVIEELIEKAEKDLTDDDYWIGYVPEWLRAHLDQGDTP